MPKITNNAKNDQILPKMPKFTKNEIGHPKYAKNPQKCKKSPIMQKITKNVKHYQNYKKCQISRKIAKITDNAKND